jgi:hypothetical protein
LGRAKPKICPKFAFLVSVLKGVVIPVLNHNTIFPAVGLIGSIVMPVGKMEGAGGLKIHRRNTFYPNYFSLARPLRL